MKTTNQTSHLILTAALALLTLPACTASDVRGNLGLNNGGPDEFLVTRRAPLEITQTNISSPSALPAPRLGAQRPQESSVQDDVRNTLITSGSGRSKGAKGSKKDYTFNLKKHTVQDRVFLANFTTPDSDIRTSLNSETAKLAQENLSVAQRLKSLAGQAAHPTSRLVDPTAEAKRIKDNRENGAPLTRGDTPTYEE